MKRLLIAPFSLLLLCTGAVAVDGGEDSSVRDLYPIADKIGPEASPKVSRQTVDLAGFNDVLASQGLQSRWSGIINTSVDKDELLKLNPCLSGLSALEIGSYRGRLEKLLRAKLVRADSRFASAIEMETAPFDDSRKAFASASLRLNNQIPAGGYSPNEFKRALELSKQSISRVDPFQFDASKLSEAERKKGSVIAATNEGFRSILDDQGVLRCQINVNGEMNTIVNEEHYINTPCYSLGVDVARLPIEEQLEEDENPPTDSACSIVHWKWHVQDFAWKNVVAERNFISGAFRPGLLVQSDMMRSLLASAGVRGVSGSVSLPASNPLAGGQKDQDENGEKVKSLNAAEEKK